MGDVSLAARSSRTLLVQGESGTGKELAARLFHEAGPSRRGPFIAVNCAAIPTGLAERLLFGAKKGAYSGAADATGYIAAGHGGVFFLDEAGELDLAVQAKLLRAIETSEIIALGASSGRQVDVRYCFATHRDLRESVREGRFRADLYHRIAPPEVWLPPLRERLDEVPWHVHAEVTGVSPDLAAHVKLVEACMLRPWPGNVRELRRQVRFAAERALSEAPAGSERPGPATSPVVTLEHMSTSAGLPYADEATEEGAPRIRQYAPRREPTTRERVMTALQDSSNNVAAAARLLGLHRNQLYREMERWGIEVPK
jgi:transcriptional regulator with GAF, ATPase, and Fis domain